MPHSRKLCYEGDPAGSRDPVGECSGVSAGGALFSRAFCGGLCASASIRGRIFLRKFVCRWVTFALPEVVFHLVQAPALAPGAGRPGSSLRMCASQV
jgi:hypothetical protein